MATSSTTPVSKNFNGFDFTSYLAITVTDPNPSGWVQVSWDLWGTKTGVPTSTSCTWIKGFITSGNYDDQKALDVVADPDKPNFRIKLHEGINGDGRTYRTYACCRISIVEDKPDFLKVTLRNYLEWVLILPFKDFYDWSQTRVVTVWVKKVPAGVQGGQ